MPDGSVPEGNVGGIAAEALCQYVDRIERLATEKNAIAADIKQVFDEAKATGFDVKIIRKLIAIRKTPEHARQEEEEVLVLYKRALGMD